MSIVRLRREGLAWSDIGGETIILDLETSTYFAAKGAGSFLLGCLMDGIEEDLLAAQLVEHFEVSVEIAQQDTMDFLRDLDQRQLLERVHA